MPTLQLDHIVLAVPSLEEASRFFQEKLGIMPIPGGRHVGFGTHNALLGLGDPSEGAYLELLAIDPSDETSYEHYPMNLSKDMQEPYVATWCVRCSPDDDLKEINARMSQMGEAYQHGSVRKMQRTTQSGEVLAWVLANAREQVFASQGQIPFLIKWDNLVLHPTTKIPAESFCDYTLEFFDPHAEEYLENLKIIGLEDSERIRFTQALDTSSSFKLTNKEFELTFTKSQSTNRACCGYQK